MAPTNSDTSTVSSTARKGKWQIAEVARNVLLLIILLHELVRSRQTLTQLQDTPNRNMFANVSTADMAMADVVIGMGGGDGSRNSSVVAAQSYEELFPPTYDYRRREKGYIPLNELVKTGGTKKEDCPKGTFYVEDTILPESITHAGRKIPRVVHITSKSRCTSKAFLKNIDKWRLANHSVYYHDDAAVDRLFAKQWPEFPHIQLIMKCLISGAAKADLWRYLVLWEYGGIYSDIDTAPGPRFNETTIRNFDDSWFVVERLGVLSQYFMSASAKHPLMYMTVHATLLRLMGLESVLNQYVPYITGPGALKMGMILFMDVRPLDAGPFQRVPRGFYTGINNRTVTVRGSKQTSQHYIQRTAVNGFQKKKGYAQMGQVHFNGAAKALKEADRNYKNVSCLALAHQELYDNVNASTRSPLFLPNYYR